jgi:hypothetical protein
LNVPSAPRLRGLPVFGFAVLGLLLGHALSYLIAVPDPHHRDLILQRTGHGYLPAFGELAAVLALAGVASLVVRAFACRGGRPPETAPVGLLVTIQVAAFLGQEVLERVVAGAPLGDLLSQDVLAIGVIAQVAVATVAAFTLRWLTRAAAGIAAFVEPRAALPRPVAVGTLPDSVSRPLAPEHAGPRSPRGPPSS